MTLADDSGFEHAQDIIDTLQSGCATGEADNSSVMKNIQTQPAKLKIT